MNLDELSSTDATLDEDASRLAVAEIFTTSGWRIYTEEMVDDLRHWAQRFFDAHARVPGLISEAMIALAPINVLRCYRAGPGVDVAMVEGAIYQNGAVLHLHDRDGGSSVMVAIRPDDAEYWGYPADGYFNWNEESETE